MTLTLPLSHAIAHLDLHKVSFGQTHECKWACLRFFSEMTRRLESCQSANSASCDMDVTSILAPPPPQTLSLNICFSISNPDRAVPEKGYNKIIEICLHFISSILAQDSDSSIMPFSGMCPTHSNVEIFLFLFSFLFSFGLSLLSERKSLEIMSYVGSHEQ